VGSRGPDAAGYVRQEFDESLKCGRLEHGFLRVQVESVSTVSRVRTSAVAALPASGSRPGMGSQRNWVDEIEVFLPLPDSRAPFCKASCPWLDKPNDRLILLRLQSCPSDVPTARTWHAVQIEALALVVSKPFRSIIPSPFKQECDAPQVCSRCDT